MTTGMADLGTSHQFLTPKTCLANRSFKDVTNALSIPLAPAYSVSKAALNMLVAKYSAIYSAQGILFLSLSPGLVDTSEGKPQRKFLTPIFFERRP